jgi:hypothetical protein
MMECTSIAGGAVLLLCLLGLASAMCAAWGIGLSCIHGGVEIRREYRGEDAHWGWKEYIAAVILTGMFGSILIAIGILASVLVYRWVVG